MTVLETISTGSAGVANSRLNASEYCVESLRRTKALHIYDTRVAFGYDFERIAPVTFAPASSPRRKTDRGEPMRTLVWSILIDGWMISDIRTDSNRSRRTLVRSNPMANACCQMQVIT